MSLNGINIIKKAKKLLRSEIKKKVLPLSLENKLKQSAVVQRKLLAHEEWKKSRRVSIFLNTADEVSTLDILRSGFEAHKRMFIPRYSKTTMDMAELRSMADYESLPTTSWHIKQPPLDDHTREVVNTENGGLDLIIMPGLAFTMEGHRLGRGGGYYDAYLNNYKSQFGTLPFLIAPTFKQQMVEYIACTDLDVNVNVVLVDENAYDN